MAKKRKVSAYAKRLGVCLRKSHMKGKSKTVRQSIFRQCAKKSSK